MKKIELIQLVIIGRIICSISEVICCKHIQQYILSKKDADINDRLKRGLIFLVPYKENEISFNSNENSREKTIRKLQKSTNQKLKKTKHNQQESLKIFLHFNNTIERNQNITHNTKYLKREHFNDSYTHMNFISDPKEIVKTLFYSHKISNNEKNINYKNPIAIILDQKANRSRRMSQKKYMCHCKESNCKDKQCIQQQIQQQFPWKNKYFEDISIESNDKSSVNDYELINTLSKNAVSSQTISTEPKKFNIPFANNINFDQSVIVGNEKSKINQQPPDMYYPNSQLKIQQNLAFPIYQYNPYTMPHHGMVFAEIMPIHKQNAAVTSAQMMSSYNYVPSTFGRNFHNINECIKLYGDNVCIISTTTKPTVNKFEIIDTSNDLFVKTYSSNRKNKLPEYYTKKNSLSVKLPSSEYDEMNKFNSNLNFNNYRFKKIIKNNNSTKNIKHTSTNLENSKGNILPKNNMNPDFNLYDVDITNLNENKYKFDVYIRNIANQTLLHSNNEQQLITVKPPEAYNIKNANKDVEFFTNYNILLNQNHSELYNNDLAKNYKQWTVDNSDYKSNFNAQRSSTVRIEDNSIEQQREIPNAVQLIHNNLKSGSETNDHKNRSVLLKLIPSNLIKEQFKKYNNTEGPFKKLNRVPLNNNNNKKNRFVPQNSSDIEKNFHNPYQQNIIKNIDITQKPLYGQTRRSTTEHDRKLIQLNDKSKLSFQIKNVTNLKLKTKFEKPATLVHYVNERPSITSQNASENNYLNYNMKNKIMANLDIISLLPNHIAQTYGTNDTKILIINKNKIIQPDTNFHNKRVHLGIATEENVNEILLQNVIKKVINNFVPGKAQDLLTNYENQNISKFCDSNMEDIFPEILEISSLKNLFSIPEVENLITDKAKNFLFGITGSPYTNVQIIKNVLHNVIEERFLSRTTVVSTITNENHYQNDQWVTERIMLLEKLQKLTTMNQPLKEVLDKIHNVINKSAIREQDVKNHIIRNLIIKTVKHSLDKERGTIDETIIRQAFELLLYSKSNNSSNTGSVSRKISTTKMKKSLILQPNTTMAPINNNYKSEIPVTESSLQNDEWIEQKNNLVAIQQNEHFNFNENKNNLLEEKFDGIQLKQNNLKNPFIDDTTQKYNLNVSNIHENSKNLKLLLEDPMNNSFSNKKIEDQFSEKFKSSVLDDSTERKPIKYFSPNDRILEYIKNHKNSDNSNVQSISEIIGYTNEYKIDRETHPVFKRIPIKKQNLSNVHKNRVNQLDNELSNFQSNANNINNIEEKENSKRHPLTINSNEDELFFIKKSIVPFSEISFASDSRTPRNNEPKTYMKTKEIKQINNGLNQDQIFNLPRNKFLQSLLQNKYDTNSLLFQNFTYFGKLVPINNNISNIKIVDDLQESNLMYIDDGVKIPRTIKEMQEGTFSLTLSNDVCKGYVHKNCSCCFPNVNKTLIMRERRSDETIPQVNIINKQQDIEKRTIDWFLKTFSKVDDLIPNLTLCNESMTTSQKSRNDEFLRDSAGKNDTRNDQFYEMSEFNDKILMSNSIEKEKNTDSTFEKGLNNSIITVTDNSQLINNYNNNTKNNKENETKNNLIKVELKNDTNEIKQRNDDIKKRKENKNFKKFNIKKKNNDYRNFQTNFDYERNNLIFHKLKQAQNHLSNVNTGPPYKYQRYADEDMIVSRRIRMLKNVLHFMKDFMINASKNK